MFNGSRQIVCAQLNNKITFDCGLSFTVIREEYNIVSNEQNGLRQRHHILDIAHQCLAVNMTSKL